eukprot:TRINITY_DN7856_c0_g1_i1.p1 TRINITY_DN7856_c0_g1~~TRINITY_DN7856_c0_g1_i1.p1  ORF type:complete len:369 (+),score=57.02 TRINITY_DN7856_c0_g1_i1:65-1108(+)
MKIVNHMLALFVSQPGAVMKAAVYRKYGGPEVVSIEEVAKPTIQKDDEILVRTISTTVSTGDWRGRSLDLPSGFGIFGRLVFGFTGPRQPILGTELSGIVESVGNAVTKFKPGDQVIVFTGGKYGCHAQFRVVSQSALVVHKPANLSFDEAAALSFGGNTALHFLRKASIAAGQSVLVVGASGCVGSACVQLAKFYGAEVTAVCSSANADLVRSIGADHVIDYTAEDFAQRRVNSYDMIIDTCGTCSMRTCEPVLKQGGKLIAILGSFRQAVGLEWATRGSGKTVLAGPCSETLENLELLADLASKGKYRPLIDQVFAFEDIVQAHSRVDSGRKRGSVIVRIAEDPK